MSMKDKSAVIYVTPAMAQRWFDDRAPNRPYNDEYATKLAIDSSNMVNWRLNGETLKFNEFQCIIDGQHRLSAICKSGVGIWTHVAYDVPNEFFDSIDVGRPRTAAQVLARAGEPNAALLGAILSLLHRYELRQLDAVNNRAAASIVLDLLKKYPEARQSATFASGNTGPLLHSVNGFLHYLGTKCDAWRTEAFLRKVQTGENISKGQPAYALRNQLLGIQGRAVARLNQTAVAAIGIQTLTADLLNTPRQYVRWDKGTDFPVFPVDKIQSYAKRMNKRS